VLYIAAAPWPAFYGGQFLKENTLLAGTWVVSCVVMSGFTLLPANKVEDLNLMYVLLSDRIFLADRVNTACLAVL
jgi:phosphatidylinositol glycan class N